MKNPGIWIVLALLCFTSLVSPQSENKYVKILEGRGKTAGQFVDNKTIIAEIEYVGLDVDQEAYGIFLEMPVYERNLVSELQFRKLGVNVEEPFAAYKVHQVEKFTKDWLDERGYPRAAVSAMGQSVGETQMRLRFVIERGEPLTAAEIFFTGNENVSSTELIEDFEQCSKGRGFSKRLYDYCAQNNSRSLMWSKGFFKAKINEISYSLRKNARVVRISISEGRKYRIGHLKIEGNKVFSDEEILAVIDQRPGETANGRKIKEVVYEHLKEKYDDLGYIEFSADFEPVFIDPLESISDGIVNIVIWIDEGRRYSINTIDFVGVSDVEKKALLAEFPLKPEDIYVPSRAEAGIDQINKSGRFAYVDKDQDVEVRTGIETAEVDLYIKIRKR